MGMGMTLSEKKVVGIWSQVDQRGQGQQGDAVCVGVCSTDLRLDTSTYGLKQVYTSPEAI
jgi:hypothetical protein